MARNIPKGTVLNPNGRPKGSENAIKSGTREKIKQFLETTILPDLESFYAKLKPSEKATFVPKMIEFIIPKQREHKVDIEPIEVNHNETIITKFPKNFDLPVPN